MTIGTPRRFFKKFKFVVEIDEVASAGFQKAGPLGVEIGEVVYREGGRLIATKDPGLVNFKDLTLERGVTNDFDLFTWLKQVVDATNNGGIGLNVPEFKRNFDLVQQDRDGSTVARWRGFNAWPKDFDAGEWDNDAEENVIEVVTLSVELWDRIS